VRARGKVAGFSRQFAAASRFQVTRSMEAQAKKQHDRLNRSLTAAIELRVCRFSCASGARPPENAHDRQRKGGSTSEARAVQNQHSCGNTLNLGDAQRLSSSPRRREHSFHGTHTNDCRRDPDVQPASRWQLVCDRSGL